MKLLYQGNRPLQLQKRSYLEFPVHLHNAMELVWLIRGSTTVIGEADPISLSPGDLYIAFPGQVHGYRDQGETESYVLIAPTTPYLENYTTLLEQNRPLCPVLPKGSWEHTGVDKLLQMATDDVRTASQKMMQGYILLILEKLLPLMELGSCPTGNADATQSLLLYINSHYTDPLTRQEIARATGYHESYISHIFSDVLHTTLTDYITTLRIDDARRLLTDTRLTVSQIALSLGFGSIRTFNRVFLQQTGKTPTAYRANNL